MRTPIYALIAALFIGGCTHYHVTPAGAPVSRPDRIVEPEPEPIEPLELDIGRPVGAQLLIQTNRPAYVAIFEIVPNQGVTLIYPAAEHQRNMMISGLTWVPLWWSPRRVSFNSDRYIYAVAAEEPLQLSGETFLTGYFSRVLGLGIYRAERPYATMRAISRAVVPDVAAEAWAEDVHIVTPNYLTETYRTARIYCPGGRVFDVPDDMVARIWCPTRTRVVIIDPSRPRSRDYPMSRPARPDSVYGQGGVRVRLEPRRPRGPVIRVVDPTDRDRDVRRGRDDRDERSRDMRDDRDDRDDQNGKPDKDRRNTIKDLIDAKKEAQERAKEERERQRREAEEARRREAEERKERKDERDAWKEERKEERKDERDARKEEREERKDERKDEPKQQGEPHEEKRDEKRAEKQEEKQDARDEKRDDKGDDKKGHGNIKDLIRGQKEKKDKP
jgi:hypothetical protein